MEKLLTVSEVAKKLDLSRGRVYQFCKDDPSFPHVRIGGSIRVKEAALQAWIDSRRGQLCGDGR